jgi:hypothetical protein
MRYRKMTLCERIRGRPPDTDEVVVYKNYTLAEWFFGKSDDCGLQYLTALQRTVGIAGLVVIGALLWLEMRADQ